MDTFVDFYRDVLGFAQLIHYDDKVIHTDYSALMSKVMTNGNGRIKFPINEPATGKKKSQIQEFLDWYLVAGLPAHRAAHRGHRRDRPPAARERRRVPRPAARVLRDPRRPRRRCRRADRRRSRSSASRPTATRRATSSRSSRRPVQDRPTFFFEIIERHGSRGFGVGNFKALFEAIEREQAKRGNL